MTRIISIVGGLQPSTPIIGTATAGDANASVAFTPSTYIGKGTITYTATSSPGNLTGTASSSPITVSGLTNGTAYTFTVTGNTNYGVASLASAASNSITPSVASVGSFDALASYTVPSGGVSSVTFSGFPLNGQYSHLQLRLIAKDTRNDSALGNPINMRFNGDTGNSYSYHYLLGAGGGTVTQGNETTVNKMSFYTISTNTANANNYGIITIDIPDYANTNKNKTVKSLGGVSANTGTNAESVFIGSGSWRNTAAINSITLYSDSFNIVQNSQFDLYGLRG